jgi:DNA-binding NtrC family response regulator
LRERKEDIPLLTSYFLNRLGLGHPNKSITKESLELLSQYDWPGNVRELKNVIERALILSDMGAILPKYLPPEILEGKTKKTGLALKDMEIPPEGLPLEDIEKEAIRKALTAVSGNISKAARILHISRDTLRYRIKSLGIII